MLKRVREAGRVLSQKNQDKLKQAADHIATAHGHVAEVLGSVGDEADPLAGADVGPQESRRPVAEAERSFGQIQSLVSQAVCDAFLKPGENEWDCYLSDLYDDYAVVRYDGRLWSVPWAIQDGGVSLGTPTEVIVTYAPASDATGDGDADGDDGDLAPAGVPTQESRRLSEKDFSAQQRKTAAKSGAAMPDGSFPIESVGDLDDAVKAFGRAKNPAAVKAHIVKRAKALGATDHLPADWPGSTKEEAARPLSLTGDVIPLVEKAVAEDSTVMLKVIQPGWGSSGYYPAEMLERDGPNAFPSGTKMYWNHPSISEEQDRPERDLRDLAAVTTSPATWQAEGPAGPGLYAEATVMAPYREAVEELAPHIGVSIRAEGTAPPGTVEGKRGPVVEAITAGHSIDFVTTPGAGGEILSLFEAARGGQRVPVSPRERSPEMGDQHLTEALAAEKAGRERLERALAATKAEALVERSLGTAHDLPEAAKERVRAAILNAELPLAEGQLDATVFATRLTETVQHERDYIAGIAASLGAGRVLGMGSSGANEPSAEELDKQLSEALKSW